MESMKVIDIGPRTLNKRQVDALFLNNAVMIGTEDVIPESRVVDVFGREAAEAAMSIETSGRFWNFYGTGATGGFHYLTYRGFLKAATFYNSCQLTLGEQL